MPETLVYQYVYRPHALDALRVYARKRIAATLKSQISKLLILNALTLVSRTKEPVYRQHPIWG